MTPFSINIKGRLVEYGKPAVMAILNVTHDSFFEGSRVTTRDAIIRRVEKFLSEGADIIDVGAYSTRPGNVAVSVSDELKGLDLAIDIIRSINSDIPVSVDTFRSEVAYKAIKEMGADIINDVSFCIEGESMVSVASELKAPYILTHCQGSPEDHFRNISTENTMAMVIRSFAEKIQMFNLAGVNDLIVDPGFGFGKSIDFNYRMMQDLGIFCQFGLPVLVGISRKSMFTRPLGIRAEDALAATISANTIAVLNGASILRVHDVAAARDTIAVCNLYDKAKTPQK